MSDLRSLGLAVRRLRTSDGPTLATIGRSTGGADPSGDLSIDHWVRRLLAAVRGGEHVVVLEAEGPFGLVAVGVGHAEAGGTVVVSIADDWKGTGADELIRHQLDLCEQGSVIPPA